MGSWGHGAFDNDFILDEVEQLTTTDGVRLALSECVLKAVDGGSQAQNAASLGHGGAEVIAAVLAGETYWQSEGTTLFENADPDAPKTVYLPEEVAAFVATKPPFSAADLFAAFDALEALERPEVLAPWFDQDGRLDGIDATRRRLQAAAEIVAITAGS